MWLWRERFTSLFSKKDSEILRPSNKVILSNKQQTHNAEISNGQYLMQYNFPGDRVFRNISLALNCALLQSAKVCFLFNMEQIMWLTKLPPKFYLQTFLALKRSLKIISWRMRALNLQMNSTNWIRKLNYFYTISLSNFDTFVLLTSDVRNEQILSITLNN